MRSSIFALGSHPGDLMIEGVEVEVDAEAVVVRAAMEVGVRRRIEAHR